MRTSSCCRVCVGALLILLFGGVVAVSQGESPDMVVTRSISTAVALPESVFQVTLRVEAHADLYGAGIREVLPTGWEIHPIDNDGAAFKRSEGEWVFDRPIEAGTTRILIYEVEVPAAGALLSDPLPQCFTISGMYQTTVPSLETATLGESTVEIDSALPIPTAIAHLVPAYDGAPDRIDLRLSPKLSDGQIARALELWSSDLVVPATGGERIDLAMMNRLVALYESCTRAQDALPLSVDPQFDAVRTIETALPCDSVLLPEGCFDPGPSAREVTVHVKITPSYDAYGVALKEWVPDGWRVTPVEHDGFVYRPSALEWVYPDRLAAGESVELTYTIEALPTAASRVEAGGGCCGQEEQIGGEVSSGLECSVAPVTGEDTVLVLDCAPVILAISRWDVDEDRFDAKLSNLITLPQVQRAVRFWQESLPVPHTCGYTVGYETLKQIVAYWITGTPVTDPLPADIAATCGGSLASCGSGCTEGWLCRMLDAQDPEDFAGLPDSPAVVVNGGPDRTISCAAPSVTLTAVVTGGVPPIQYEWIGPSGQALGDTPSIEVGKPGDYSVLVVSCGGCMATDTVTVHGDFSAPTIEVSDVDELTGYVTKVELKARVEGGVAPIDVAWTGPSGERLGAGPAMTVSEPGTYAATATGANGCSATATVEVTQDIEPPAVAIEIAPTPALAVSVEGANAVLTCAIPQATLTGHVTGGRPPYTLTWTDSEGKAVGSEVDLEVDEPGTYRLTATGSNGCSATAEAVVAEDTEAPSLNASVDGVLTCAVSQVTLRVAVTGGRAPYTLEWINEAGERLGDAAELVASLPGRYTVKVTGANGCEASAEVTVTEDVEAPSVAAGTSGVLTCATTAVTLTAAVTGGRSPFQYVWTDSAGNAVGETAEISVSAPDTYRVSVTGANGCVGEATAEVTQDIAAPTVETAVSGVLTCAVTSVDVNANISGGRSPFTIQWKDAQGKVVGTAALLSVSAPGVYTVQVTGANGCSTSGNATVTQDIEAPTVTACASGILTCATTAVTLTASVSGGRAPFQYAWSDSAGHSVGEAAQVSVSDPGDYRVMVTGANGCVGEAAVTVTEDVAAPIVSASVSHVLTCAVTEVSLAASVSGGRSPYTYLWTNEAGKNVGTTSEIVVQASGDYTITVTGANGCSTSATVPVEEDVAPPCLSVGSDRTLTCAEPAITVDASVCGGRAPFTFRWTDDCGTVIATTEDVTLHFAGTYTLTVTGANGCSASDSLTVLDGINPPSVDAGPDRTLACVGDEVTLDATVTGGACPYTYTWVNSCEEVVGHEEDLTVSTPGTYILTVRSADGCIAMDSATVTGP